MLASNKALSSPSTREQHLVTGPAGLIFERLVEIDVLVAEVHDAIIINIHLHGPGARVIHAFTELRFVLLILRHDLHLLPVWFMVFLTSSHELTLLVIPLTRPGCLRTVQVDQQLIEIGPRGLHEDTSVANNRYRVFSTPYDPAN